MSLKRHQLIGEVPLKDSSFRKWLVQLHKWCTQKVVYSPKKVPKKYKKNHRKVGSMKIYFFLASTFFLAKKALKMHEKYKKVNTGSSCS